MPEAPTGRSRTALVTATAEYAFNPGALDTGSGGYAPVRQSAADVSGWGAAASVRAGIAAISSFGFDITFFLAAWFGAPVGDPDIYVEEEVHLSPDGSQGSFPKITDLVAGAVGTAAYTLTEYEDLAAPYEKSGPAALELEATVTIEFETLIASYEPPPPPVAGIVNHYEPLFHDSVTLTGSWSGTSAGGAFGSYSHRIQQLAQRKSAGGSFAVLCDSISYSRALSETAGGASLGGSVTAPALAADSAGHIATLILQAEPDFALEATAQARFYGGDPFPGAELEYRLGAAVVDSAATDAAGVAVLHYPSSGYYGAGYASWVWVIFGDGDGHSVSYDNGEHLSTYLGAVRVQEAWADAYGADLSPDAGTGTAMGLYCMERFTAGELALAPSHAFRLFDSITGWTAFDVPYRGGIFSMDAGVWKWTWDAPGDRAGPYGTAFHGSAFLPLLYRYYTLRLKSDTAGAQVTLQASLFLGTFGGSDYYATAEWDFTIEAADTWEDHEFDWLFPTRMSDQVRATGGFPQRYPFHPFLCQQQYEATGQAVGIALSFRTTDAAYWIDGLSGEQKSAGARTSATLHAPLQTPYSASRISGALVAFQDTTLNGVQGGPGTVYIPDGTLSVMRQGGNWGWLVVNGAIGMYLQSAGTVQAAWEQLLAWYDDAARDTGLTVTLTGHALAARNQHATSYLVEDGITMPRPPTGSYTPAAVPLVCVRRLASMYGYYGMGASYENGAYGATLVYQGDLWFDGELEGLLWKARGPLIGAAVEVLDNDTEAVLDTVTTDEDGLFAASLKDGRRLPFASVPANNPAYTDHGYAPPDYTAVGLLLNSYWLRSSSFRYRDGGDVAKYSPNVPRTYNFRGHRQDFTVLTRYPSHYDLEAGAPSHSPDSLTDPLGRFHRVSIDDEQLVYRRADYNTPEGGSWVNETELGADCSEPSIAIDAQDLQLRARVVYTRDDGVYERTSDDDGETFEPEVLMIPDGAHPRPISGHPFSEEQFIVAFVPADMLQAVYRGPGDAAWSDVFTFLDESGVALSVADDSFGMILTREPGTGLLRWVLSVVIAGESAVSEWICDSEPDWDAPEMRWERVT